MLLTMTTSLAFHNKADVDDDDIDGDVEDGDDQVGVPQQGGHT